MTINQERVLKWVERLESGEYPQGKNTLIFKETADDSSKRYCCLGVACEMYLEEHPNMSAKYDEGDHGTLTIPYRGHAYGAYLPRVIPEWFGFDEAFQSTSPAFGAQSDWNDNSKLTQGRLGSFNDGTGTISPEDFMKIAARIREYAGLPPREETEEEKETS
jgi:hypothetical protein